MPHCANVIVRKPVSHVPAWDPGVRKENVTTWIWDIYSLVSDVLHYTLDVSPESDGNNLIQPDHFLSPFSSRSKYLPVFFRLPQTPHKGKHTYTHAATHSGLSDRRESNRETRRWEKQTMRNLICHLSLTLLAPLWRLPAPIVCASHLHRHDCQMTVCKYTHTHTLPAKWQYLSSQWTLPCHVCMYICVVQTQHNN